MKPIEPGCLCIFVNLDIDRHLNGKQCTIKEYDADSSRFFKEPMWVTFEVDVRSDGLMADLVAEKNLMRIDGYEDDKSIVEVYKELEKS